MIRNLLLGLAIAVSYLIGAAIYFYTHEEISSFLKKHPKLRLLTSYFYGQSAALGGVVGLSTVWFEFFALLIFAFIVVQSAIFYEKVKKKIALSAAKAFLIFLITFALTILSLQFF